MAHHPSAVLVTGGGGFLGSAVVRQFLKRGDRVRSLSRNLYPMLDAWGVEQIQGDVGDLSAVQRAASGMDLVVHTAAKAGVWGPWEAYAQANVTGTENVIAACVSNGIKRLVHTSSPSVVFDGSDMEGVDESIPLAPQFHAAYPATKAKAETLVRNASSEDLGTICLRPHLIWGPGDNHLVPRILARGPRLAQIGDGKNKVDTVYIDNAAEAHLLAADALARSPALSGRVYFITNDQPIPLWEMVNRFLSAGGLPPVRRRMSAASARRIGSILEWIYRTFRIPAEPPMTRFLAEELATSHWFDISAARSDLGYRPRVSVDEGLRRLESWLKRQLPIKESRP
ncbi:MAG: NAD-dependent epimerase/dehydratase family protein [Desulfobacterales bacterium]